MRDTREIIGEVAVWVMSTIFIIFIFIWLYCAAIDPY